MFIGNVSITATEGREGGGVYWCRQETDQRAVRWKCKYNSNRRERGREGVYWYRLERPEGCSLEM